MTLPVIVPPGTPEAALRAGLIGFVLAWLAPRVQRQLERRRWLWWFVLLPLLTPSVVIAFGYVGWSPGNPATVSRELGYGMLLAARLLPVAVILQFVLPEPPLSSTARHCMDLAGAPQTSGMLYGPLRNRLMVGGLVFVLAFQEFDLASLFFGVRSWAVAVFDAQVGGLPLADTLAQAVLPILIELAVLLAVTAVLFTTRDSRAERTDSPRRDHPRSHWGWLGPVIATGLVTAWPGCLLLACLPGVGRQLPFLDQVWHSAVLAGGATACALTLAGLGSLPLLCALSIPGLASGLVLALAIVAVFQLPVLAAVYDTPIPILTAWTLMLLPIATIFRVANERLAPSRAVHLSRMLEGSPVPRQRREGRRLYFAMRGSHLGLAGSVLFLLAFFEVVAGPLLAPSGMQPAAPTLCNMMHYGRSPGLAAMVILMVGGALCCTGIGYALWRLGRRGVMAA